MKKFISLLMCVVMIFAVTVTAFAANPDDAQALAALFKDGEGPEADGVSIDYVYYEPEVAEGEKLPVVIYFHGMNQGGRPRAQIARNNFSLWASPELQSRFTGGGAYLIAPRSHEENNEYWPDYFVPAVKALIDDFISSHADTVDLSRIYVGGFSMGGKMTLKMISSYPSYFAAAFPMCPAYPPSEEQIAAFADMPVWLMVSRFDIIAGYYTFSKDFWETLCEVTTVPTECRLSLFGVACYPDGRKAMSNHHVWFAASNDLFTYDEGKYPNMVTTNALNEEITLESPNGLISWLCEHTSDYAGEEIESTGLLEKYPEQNGYFADSIKNAIFPLVLDGTLSLFTEVIPSFFFIAVSTVRSIFK